MKDLESNVQTVWSFPVRLQFEQMVKQGVGEKIWGLWKNSPGEAYFLGADQKKIKKVESDFILVDPDSDFAKELEKYRPKKGPEPVETFGTPREALTRAWEELSGQKDLALSEFSITLQSRETFDNTVRAAMPDLPESASAKIAIEAEAVRETDDGDEELSVNFKGRFSEAVKILPVIWPFQNGGKLSATIVLDLVFAPPVDLADAALIAFRDSMAEANQGEMEVRLTPVRATSQEEDG